MASVFRTGRGQREAGYTMAELLIVLMIVGLIAALAVPNIGGAVKRAEETALRENLAVMRKALDDYIADRGAGPDEPIDTNETDAGRARNRRIEFRILDEKEIRQTKGGRSQCPE